MVINKNLYASILLLIVGAANGAVAIIDYGDRHPALQIMLVVMAVLGIWEGCGYLFAYLRSKEQ